MNLFEAVHETIFAMLGKRIMHPTFFDLIGEDRSKILFYVKNDKPTYCDIDEHYMSSKIVKLISLQANKNVIPIMIKTSSDVMYHFLHFDFYDKIEEQKNDDIFWHVFNRFDERHTIRVSKNAIVKELKNMYCMMKRLCMKCGKLVHKPQKRFKKCSRCGIRYCSIKCQNADWKMHKPNCGKT